MSPGAPLAKDVAPTRLQPVAIPLPKAPESPISPAFPSYGSYPAYNIENARRKRESLKLDPIGIPPTELVGKVLRKIARSSAHPTVTLYFTDKTSYQIRVDGYNPAYPGLPKAIETNPALESVFHALEHGAGDVEYTISHAAIVSLADRAYELGEKKESEWVQHHAALAFKFKEEGRWHCVWVTLAEHDKRGRCIFRTFDDVYLAKLDQRPPKKRGHSKQKASIGQRNRFSTL
ncbi:hypothetical protein EUX98_g2398 [Antrodiella citrinella]|uniref:Uncharacterized protein n=1 Tax=Antrodiella citrinella TaxID=2447956 RepID=A0A4S4N239_9APHY|nr:hypothetical protein EUX98_g2398 [Antrodiella citrinella]